MRPLGFWAGTLIFMSYSGCTGEQGPEVFGVTMVEETTCIGQGGQIVIGPQGAYCATADVSAVFSLLPTEAGR